jgi:hypothetical protein
MPSPFRIIYKQRRQPYHFISRKSMKDNAGSSQALLTFAAHVSAKMNRDAL